MFFFVFVKVKSKYNQGRRGGRSGVRRCIRIDMLSSLPSVFPFSPQSSSRYSQEHKKTAPFFQKKRKTIGKKQNKKTKKQKKTPNLSFGCAEPEKLTRRAVILDANSGCGGRPGPPRVYLGPRQCNFCRFLFNFHVFVLRTCGVPSIQPVFPTIPVFCVWRTYRYLS